MGLDPFQILKDHQIICKGRTQLFANGKLIID